MSKQRNKKLWAVIGLILAGLVLGINAFFARQGSPLPGELTGYAEDVVATSVNELGLNGDAPSETPIPTKTPHTQAAARPTRTPIPEQPSTSEPGEPGDAPWLAADIEFAHYVLALSWQPAFCETRPDKEECVTQTAARYDASNFALHGLWPNLENDPNHAFGYCGVSRQLTNRDKDGDWCEMPRFELSDEVWTDLTTFMPGTTSCLHNHEWYKHGTCAGMSAEAYFALGTHLVELFSTTAFDDYVAANAGRTVGRNTLLDKFDAEFGPDASDYLSLRCSNVDGTSLLTEIQLTLRTDIAPDAGFDALFPTDDVRPQGNCPSQFKIDLVGLDNF